eukprot:1348964-Lingulodinium_polyedra.AAC.1
MRKAIPLPGKNVSTYCLGRVETFIRSLRHPRLRLRSDGKPAIRAWRMALTERLPGVIQPETTP